VQLKEHSATTRTISATHQKCTNERQSLEDKITVLSKDDKDCQSRIFALEQQLLIWEECHIDCSIQDDRIVELEDQRQPLSDTNNAYKDRIKSLTEFHRDCESTIQRLTAKRKDHKALKSEFKQLEERLQSISEDHRDCKQRVKSLTIESDAHKGFGGRIRSLIEKHKECEGAITRLQEEFRFDILVKLLQENVKEWKGLTGEHENMEKSMEKLEADGENWKTMCTDVIDKSQRIQTVCQAREDGLRESLAESDTVIAELRKQLNDLTTPTGN
jgi:chromosome segregation ATPase